MKKDEIFFSENGLTTTSANHICNLAKEAYARIESELNNASFYTTQVGLLGTSCSNTLKLKEGIKEEFLNNIESNLLKVAQLKSLIAWLREAIKSKDTLIKEAQNLSDNFIAEKLEIILPEKPVYYNRMTSDDVIATWGIKQRNRYYYLDTLCSTIGKYIHPERGFANAKEDLIRVLSEPNRVEGSGRDMVIYTRVPTVSIDSVNKTFFELQEKYRGYQAELNSMKHSIELALQEDDREKSQKEVEESKNYQAEMQTINSRISAYRKAMIANVIANAQALKIVIPDSLNPIYKQVSEMGK